MSKYKTTYYIFLSIVILISSCVNKKTNEQNIISPYSTNLYKLKLTRDIGELTFPTPQATDTTITWRSTTDYDCGARVNTRFANNKYTLRKETGMFDFSKIDSLKQITFSWLTNSNCKDFDLTDFKSLNSKQININGYPAKQIQDSGTARNDLKFRRLLTYLLIGSNVVLISCDCWGTDCDDIASDYKEIIKKIEIKK